MEEREPDVEQFANLLVELREYAGVSQSELARRSGVAPHTISRLEKGEIPKPGIDDVAQLARFFGIPIQNLAAALGVWSVPEQAAEGMAPTLAVALSDIAEVAATMTTEQQEDLGRSLQIVVMMTRSALEDEAHRPANGRPKLPKWLTPTRRG